jgi:hypothetical protein
MAVMLVGTLSPGRKVDPNGAMNTGTNSVIMVQKRLAYMTAFNNAEAGVEYTIQWLADRAQVPVNDGAFVPTAATPSDTATFNGGNTTVDPNYSNVAMPTGSFSIRVLPSANNPSSAGSVTVNKAYYMIESIGYSGTIGATNTVRTIVHAYVWQQPVSKYAYLIDSEQSGNWWVGGLSQADGPVHTNNTNGNKTNILWFPGTTNQQSYLWMDTDAFEDTAASANWAKNNTGTSGAPQTAADWTSIVAYGSSGVKFNSPAVAMPTTGTLQKGKALGSATAITTTGVQIPSSGGTASAGIYVKGDVKNMTLSVSNNVNQIITIVQTDSSGNPLTTVVTMTAPTTKFANSGSTTVAVTSGTTTTTTRYTGVPPSGVVYVDGTIGGNGNGTPGTGLSGTIADNVTDGSGNLIYPSSLTVATDPATTGKDVFIKDDIVYNTARARDPSTHQFLPETDTFKQKAGIFGLVAHNIWLQKYNAAGVLNQDLEVDGATLATGTMDAYNYRDTAILGNFWGMGSYTAGLGGYFGVFNGANTLTAGYNEHHNYDSRFMSNGPPGFPSTPSWKVLSWEVVANKIS